MSAQNTAHETRAPVLPAPRRPADRSQPHKHGPISPARHFMILFQPKSARLRKLGESKIMIIRIAAALAFTLAVSATAQAANVGAKYGARNPRTCATRTAPASGPISAAQARAYFICASFHDFVPAKVR